MLLKIGRYEIIEEMGRGAMGVVYRARDTEIGRVVALKVIHTANASPQDIERYKQRFRREAQAAGRLSHPGIVTIHDIAEDESGQPYIVMEFVEGRPLNLLLGPTARVPLDRLLDVGIQVAQALDFAHRNGIIHRDIKPPNILVTPDGRAKIADFGIARMEGTELTQEGISLGTPSYMSPEQFRGGAIDGRSDIFSLGAVLYWMFTGTKPFPGDTITITSFQVAYENPVLPSVAKTDLPKDLDTILTRCLAKNPENRYATCADLVADLDAVKNERPLPTRLTAKPESTEPFPLPSRRIEPARLEGTVPVPAADPEAKTRVAMAAAQSAAARPAPPRKINLLPVIAGAAGIALLLVLAVSFYIWRRPLPLPSQPAAVATPSSAVASPAVPPVTTPPRQENPPAQPAEEVKPATEPYPRAAAPRKRALKDSAPANSPQPATPAPAPPAAASVAETSPAPAEKPAASAPVVLSNLDVDCKFPFKEGTLEISVDGKPLLQENLKEKKRKLTIGITGSREFEKKDNPIPAGQHRFHVRIADKDGKQVWEDTLPVTIAKDAASKLKIDFKEGSESDPGKRKLVLTLETVK